MVGGVSWRVSFGGSGKIRVVDRGSGSRGRAP